MNYVWIVQSEHDGEKFDYAAFTTEAAAEYLVTHVFGYIPSYRWGTYKENHRFYRKNDQHEVHHMSILRLELREK